MEVASLQGHASEVAALGPVLLLRPCCPFTDAVRGAVSGVGWLNGCVEVDRSVIAERRQIKKKCVTSRVKFIRCRQAGAYWDYQSFRRLCFTFGWTLCGGRAAARLTRYLYTRFQYTALNLYSFHASFFFFACEYRAKPPNTKIKHSKGQDEGEKRRSQRIIEQLYRRRRWPSSRSSPTLPLSPP